MEEFLEEDQGGKDKGGPVIRAEVAIRLKGRKNKPLDADYEEGGELHDTVFRKALFIIKI